MHGPRRPSVFRPLAAVEMPRPPPPPGEERTRPAAAATAGMAMAAAQSHDVEPLVSALGANLEREERVEGTWKLVLTAFVLRDEAPEKIEEAINRPLIIKSLRSMATPC